MNNHAEYNEKCRRLVAKRALQGADKLNTSESIMIHRGIALMFPQRHPVHKHAIQIHDSLATAEKQQLQLFQSLDA